MDDFDIALVTVSAVVLALGLIAGWLRRKTPLSEPLLALACGVALGPVGFHVLPLVGITANLAFVEQVTRITLAIALMASALQLPYDYFARHWRAVLVLVGGGMVLTWLLSSLIVGVLGGQSLWPALLVGAAVSPTDPVLAGSLLEGQLAEHNLPARIRRLLIFESGSNDGLAYPFVLLPLLVMTDPSGRAVLGSWLLQAVVLHVVGAVAIGCLLGFVTGRLARLAIRWDTMVRASFLGIALALSLLTVGLVRLFGGDGLIGVFAAGLVFNTQAHAYHLERQEGVQSTVERFFDLPVFVLLGLTLPWHLWMTLGWAAIILPAAILLFRRIPVLLVLKPLIGPPVRRWREVLFMGWFGPIGISALFYAAYASERLHSAAPWGFITLIICASVVAHGVTATPLTRLYGRYTRQHAAGPSVPDVPEGTEQPQPSRDETPADHHREAPTATGEPTGARG